MPKPPIYARDAAGKLCCPYCATHVIAQSMARHIRTQHPGLCAPDYTPNPSHYARGLTAAEYARAYRLGIHTSFQRGRR